jgi:predicted TIM-barrel fold metal-dependent hydrolase
MEALIDCDVHPLVRGGALGLQPYMSEKDRARLTSGGDGRHGHTARPAHRYTNPSPGIVNGALRADAKPPTGEAPGTDPEFVVADLLERYHAEAVLLIPLPYTVWLNPLDAPTYVTAMNEFFISEWLTVDERFHLAACVFPLDAEAAAREIRARADTGQIAGIFMPPIDLLMGHPHYYPIYAAAVEAGLPIIVHPSGGEGAYLNAPNLAGGLPSTYTERHVGLAQVGAANVASLVCSGVFDRFPTLRVIFAEYGFSWAAPLMWRMESEAARLENDHLEKHPAEYMLENVRFCTQPIEEPDKAAKLNRLIEMMHGEQTLLFSTDYPHWDTDDPTRVLPALAPDVAQRIFYQNAKDTFAGRL